MLKGRHDRGGRGSVPGSRGGLRLRLQHDSPPTCAPSVLQEAEALIGRSGGEHGEAGETYKRSDRVGRAARHGSDPDRSILLMLSGMKLAAPVSTRCGRQLRGRGRYACLSWENRGR